VKARAIDIIASPRLIGIVAVLFVLKALVLIAVSYDEVIHDALTWDFAIFYQAWIKIASGQLNAFSTLIDQRFYKDHATTAMWPLALFAVVSRSPLLLKALQDVATAAADFVGALWVIAMLRRSTTLSQRASVALLVAALASLLLNPWTYYTDAFDFHCYTVTALFLVASVYAFYIGKRWVGVLCGLGVCTGGDASATYAVGLGLTVVLADRRLWKEGLFVAAASLGTVIGMHAMGAGVGSGISTGYGYLSGDSSSAASSSVLTVARGIVSHPGAVLSVLWEERLRIYANLGPDGWIGFFSPWVIGPWSVLLLENMLHRGLFGAVLSRFSLPGFQFGAGYAVLAPATTWVLIWLYQRFRSERFVLVAAGLVFLNAVGWGVTWLPSLTTTWVRVPRSVADELYLLNRATDDDVQIAASQGVVGGFANRSYVTRFIGNFEYLMYSTRLRFVVTPYSGLEVASVEESADAIADLLDSQWSRVIRASNLIWVIDYNDLNLYPISRARYGMIPYTGNLKLAKHRPMLPAVAFATEVGRRVLGRSADAAYIDAGNNPRAGYLLEQAYFRRPLGPCVVSMRLRAPTPVTIEIRDASRDSIIVSERYADVKMRRLDLPIMFPNVGGDDLFDGVWPFYSPAWRSTSYDALEVRVWAPAHTTAQVESVGVSGTPERQF
jgi:hypothetical protein